MVANNYFPGQGPITPNSVGGKATVWQPADIVAGNQVNGLIRPNNTNTYSAGQALGSLTSCVFQFSNFFLYPVGSGLLIGSRVAVSATGITPSAMGNLMGHLYQGVPSGANGISDGVAYPLLFADEPLYLGSMVFTTWYGNGGSGGGGAGSNVTFAFGSTLLAQQHVIGSPSNKNAYLVLVATGTSGAQLANAIISPTLSAVWD